MKAVSMVYEQGGRENQKRRTRSALVTAARELVAAGATPTVPDAAERAGISRTTAYRYFPTRRDLLAAAHPETAAPSMLGGLPPDDPAARLDECVRRFTAMVVETEPQQRTMLRLSLEEDPSARGGLPLRQGRAIAWLTEALEPARAQLGDDGLHRLVLAIRSAAGIEALAWLVDVGGLTRHEAVATMRWSAQAMLAAALSPAGPAPGPAAP
jgi:AcrR family transcriptional regulator